MKDNDRCFLKFDYTLLSFKVSMLYLLLNEMPMT